MKNGDLIVQRKAAKDFTFSFKKAESFTFWEFDAYDAYGQAECERDGIETLADLFGQEFSDEFYTAKNALLHKMRLKETKKEFDLVKKRYEELLAYIPNPEKMP